MIKIDGQVFTEYLTQAGKAPAMWPVIGPTGEPVTRSYPIGPEVEGETTDHPHHQSLWIAHDRVNGADFWAANTNKAPSGAGPHIVHREFEAIQSAGPHARVVARNDWMNGDERLCSDTRVIVFGLTENGDRWIDVTLTIDAAEGDVTFGDTKEGTFALRVADSMRLEANKGGRIVNSDGLVNDEAWGRPARWVDYSGPVSGERVGIAIFSHPSSFRPTPRWHVRGYGLFTANPFGQADFPEPEAARQGAVTVKKGDTLTMRYRVLIHRARSVSELEKAYREFAAR